MEKLKELITPIPIDPTEDNSPELDLLLKDYIDKKIATSVKLTKSDGEDVVPNEEIVRWE